MKPRLGNLHCSVILGLCLVLTVSFCNTGEALTIPIPPDWTLVSEINFVGNVTSFTYSGNVINTGEVPVGSRVNGTFDLVKNNNNSYLFGSDVSIQGKSNTYNTWIPMMFIGQVSFSNDNNNLYAIWNWGYVSDLFDLYVPNSASADGGKATFAINDYASNNYYGTGTLYYETFFAPPAPSGTSSYSVTYSISPDPEPVPEPATILLTGGGLVGWLVRRRKSRKG